LEVAHRECIYILPRSIDLSNVPAAVWRLYEESL
jgi:hypothetical protein